MNKKLRSKKDKIAIIGIAFVSVVICIAIGVSTHQHRLSTVEKTLAGSVAEPIETEDGELPDGLQNSESTAASTTSNATVVEPTGNENIAARTSAPDNGGQNTGANKNTPTKPSGGSSGTTKPIEPTTSKLKPTEPTTSKPTEPTTSKPKDFAMSPQEAVAYASSICEARGCLYVDEFNKDNAGWNMPIVIVQGDSVERIKEKINGSIDCTYPPGPGNYYKIITEPCKDAVGNDAYKIYFLY